MSVGKDSKGKEIDIKLPTLKFTEDWGKPDNEDRERIERYMMNIKGADLKTKLKNLNDILGGSVKDADVGTILSTLIMIEILSTLAGDEREFTESAAGFIFEGFIAGLFGDESVQITDADDSESQVGKPITDVILNGRHYSLKLLGPNTALKGSWTNMVGHFKDPATNGEIIYLDARRENGGLSFSEFRITLRDYMKIFSDPFKKYESSSTRDITVSAEKLIPTLATLQKSRRQDGRGARLVAIRNVGESLPKESGLRKVFKTNSKDELKSTRALMDYVSDTLRDKATAGALKGVKFEIEYQEQKDITTSKIVRRLFGSREQYDEVALAIQKGTDADIIAALEKTAGYKGSEGGGGGEQFIFTKKQAEELATAQPLGWIPLGEAALKEVWKNYAEMLLTTIDPVYRNLQEFTDNIDQFFLGAGEKGGKEKGNRRSFGEAAIREAKELRAATDKAIKIVIAEPEK
tara:strand:+ start:1568 stop:2959 length:1392 start_codon:yes stop_codon:yes gene_type:complete